MESSGYARVRSLLRYTRPARWTAIVCGIATAIIYALLVLLLALFADLLTQRGRIPQFSQLSTREQELAVKQWNELAAADRAEALHHFGFAEWPQQGGKPESWPVDTQLRWQLYQGLLGVDGVEAVPLPARMNAENLTAWATRRRLPGDPYMLAALEHEWRWRAYVWHLLKSRVGPDAAERWQQDFGNNAALVPVVTRADNRRSYGILGLVVEKRDTFWGRCAGAFAAIAGWTWRGAEPNRNYLAGIFLIGLLLVLLRGICMILMNDAAARTALEVVTRLRRSIYHHSARQGAVAINSQVVDEASELFTREVERVHEALLYSLTHSYRNAVFFPLMLMIALLTHFWLSLAFVLLAVIVWALAGQMTGTCRRQSRIAGRVAANRLELLLESLRHIRLVKSYLMELFNQSRIERQLADYAKGHLRRSRGDALARPLLTTFAVMAGLILLFLAGRVVLNDGLSVAGLVVLSTSFLSLYFPVRARLSGRRTLRHGRESAAAIFEFLDRKGDVATYPDAEFLPGVSRGIEFIDVSVRDPGSGRFLLKKVNFKLKAGQRIGIVAADPEEQHVLVSLIPRFLDPTDGEIKIDGRNLKWVTQDSLRSQVGLVLQNSMTFNDTVSNNIGCGDPSYSLPQIIEAAKLAHAHQFIQRLPYGYETSIGELGHSLSPGEQFRIAMARAILRDPALYIIEEPAEHLDDDTKDLMDDTADRVLPGKSVIYLPHRVSTLRHCERIILIHEGRIVAAGDHRELMADSELYRHLYYMEFNPFAEATA